MASFKFEKVTLPNGAFALKITNVGVFEETYPLEEISVNYYPNVVTNVGTFQIRITNKRIIAFTRADVISPFPSSTSDADLKAKLDNMAIEVDCCGTGGGGGGVCVEAGTQQGDTLYWSVIDDCWMPRETIRHAELGTALTSNTTNKNGVLISENESSFGTSAFNATISNSTTCSIDSDHSSIDCSYGSSIPFISEGSSIRNSFLSVIDNTNTPGAILNGIYNSSLSNITDAYNANFILGAGGILITGAQLGNPTTGGGRSVISSGGVDFNDINNGRRIFIDSEGFGQNILACIVDFSILNASLSIQSDIGINTIHTSFVDTDNVNAGIFDGKGIAMLACRNSTYSGNGTCEVMVAMNSTTISTGQNYTLHFQNERSTGGKQYRVDSLNFGTSLDENYNIISVDTSGGAYTYILPASPVNGQTYRIFDNFGNASVNNITVDSIVKTINSPTTQTATYIIDQDYGGINVIYDSTTDKWHVTSVISSGAGSTTCVNVGTAQGNTDVWNNSSLCWEETQAVRIATIASSFSNSGTDKEGVFISDNNSTFGVTANTSAIIACDTSVCNIKYGLLVGSNSCTLSTNTSSERNFILCCSSTNVGAAFGSDGSKNGAMLCDSYSLGAGNNNLSYSNQFSAQALNTFTVLGQGSNLQLQGNRFAFASGEDNVSTNTRNSNNIGGRHQLINHNANAGKDNTILNSPYTALNSSAVVDFTDIIAYMDAERTATNYTDNISVGGGGNIVKGGAGGAFGNGFFNSFANYVDTPVSTFSPGQIFGVNCFINSQECQLDNAFGDTAFCTFINCWQSGIINGSVSSPFVANNTIIGGGVGVGTSGSTWINGGALTESGGGVSIHGAGSQNSAVQCIQIGARGVSNIDSSNTSIQLNVISSYINNGSINCGQFNASNCLADNSESSGSMYVVLSGVGSNLGMVRVIDSLASSHCNIFTNDTATYVDLTDCEASGIRDCKFNGTLGEPNYLPAGGSWGLVNATTKSAQSMIACYNTTAEVGNNCVVMTQNGTNFTDTQDNKLHVATTRHIGGEQRKVSVYTTGTNLLTYEEHIIIADDCTVQLPTTPIDGQEYFIRHFDSTIGNDVIVDGNGIKIRVGNTNSATDTLVGGTDTMMHLVYSSVKNLWIAIVKA